MNDNIELNLEHGGPDEKRLRVYDADFTPEGIARQGLEWIEEHLDPHDDLVDMLDPSAGAGVFGMVARDIWRNRLRSVGIEPREEEESNLCRHYNEPYVGLFEDFTVECGFDVIATNPPFKHFSEFVRKGKGALRQGGYLLLLGLNEIGSRGSESRELFREWCPIQQLRIAGTVGFRGPGLNPNTGKKWGMDSRSYSFWVWQKGHGHLLSKPNWRTSDLPFLPSAERNWKVKPGEGE